MWYELIQCTPGVSTAEKMARLVDMVTALNLEGLEAVIFAGEQEIREMLPVALKLKLDTDREEDVVRAVGRIIEDFVAEIGDNDFFDDVFDVRMGTVETLVCLMEHAGIAPFVDHFVCNYAFNTTHSSSEVDRRFWQAAMIVALHNPYNLPFDDFTGSILKNTEDLRLIHDVEFMATAIAAASATSHDPDSAEYFQAFLSHAARVTGVDPEKPTPNVATIGWELIKKAVKARAVAMFWLGATVEAKWRPGGAAAVNAVAEWAGMTN
jgi:hypothetical protein